MAITLEDIKDARERIRPHIHLTPVFSSKKLGTRFDGNLFLKCENMQKTGSFKVRGVLNKLAQMTDEEKTQGVVTISAGNHAQAVAWAATASDISSVVVMPESASKAKINASKSYGAEVILEGNVFDAFEKALQIEKEQGRIFIHPFEDKQIIAGHGTAGLEIMEQVKQIDVVVVGIGGGAICTGIATAIKEQSPKTRIYGVEPEGANGMRRSLDEGKAVKLDKVETIADGLGAPMAGELTLALVQKYVEDVVIVSDQEIGNAIGELLTWTKLLAEPAGAAPVAAILNGKIPLSKGENVVAVITGGNVDLDKVFEYIKLK